MLLDPPFTPPGGGPPLKRRKPRLPPSRQQPHLRWFIHSPQTESHGIEGWICDVIGRFSTLIEGHCPEGLWRAELSTIRPLINFKAAGVKLLLWVSDLVCGVLTSLIRIEVELSPMHRQPPQWAWNGKAKAAFAGCDQRG